MEKKDYRLMTLDVWYLNCRALIPVQARQPSFLMALQTADCPVLLLESCNTSGYVYRVSIPQPGFHLIDAAYSTL
jgi:hypothetical protein